MWFSILVMAALTSPPSQKQLAVRIRELTHQMLVSQTDAEGAAISKEIMDIYAKHGVPTTSQVGDEAAYDFVFFVMSQPRSFQKEVLARIDAPGVASELPLDAVTFIRTRFRLDGIKEESKSKPSTNPSLRDEINNLYESDQAVRQKGGFDLKRLAETDRAHTERLQAILKEWGVPTYAMVGSEAAGHFVIMIQHQSPQMRELVLPVLKADVEMGQADPESYALVYDLSQVDKGAKQRYGERLVCQSGGLLHEAPIGDKEHVNERRAEIGLMRVELYSYLVSVMMPQICSATPAR